MATPRGGRLYFTGNKQKPVPSHQQLGAVPAPVGGLNARDPISAMLRTDAYDIQNWIPQQYGLKMRKGFAEWATGIGAAVSIKTVFSYFPNTATIPTTATFSSAPTSMPGKMFCATDANIYDVTSPGASPSVAQALSGTAEAGRISAVNFSNSAGTWSLFCSEIDGYFTYDGAAFVKVTLGAGATQVSVGDPTKFCQVTLWKNRVWFVEKSSSKVWYLATNALYGAAAALDVGPLLRNGGGVAWVANWTIDAGEGIDDLLVICSENGELLVYKGTDPSSVSTFGLVGRWAVGIVPKGRRGFCQIGGDLLVLSTTGITPISYVTRGGADMLSTAPENYTSKITQEFNQLMAQSFNQYGWSMTVVAREGILVVTVPDTSLSFNTQYSMTLSSGAWTRFSAMNMISAGVIAGWLFFGTATGVVNIALIGYTDGQTLAGLAGNPIVGLLQPAFNSFGRPAQLKHFLMTRVSFLTGVLPALSTSMNVDFKTLYPSSAPVILSQGPPSAWDVAAWNEGRWSGGVDPYSVWQNAPGVGYYGSLTLLTSSVDQLILTNIDYIFENGAVLG